MATLQLRLQKHSPEAISYYLKNQPAIAVKGSYSSGVDQHSSIDVSLFSQ